VGVIDWEVVAVLEGERKVSCRIFIKPGVKRIKGGLKMRQAAEKLRRKSFLGLRGGCRGTDVSGKGILVEDPGGGV